MEIFVVNVTLREQGATNVDLKLAGDPLWCRASFILKVRQMAILLKEKLDRLRPINASNFARAGFVEDTSHRKRARRAV